MWYSVFLEKSEQTGARIKEFVSSFKPAIQGPMKELQVFHDPEQLKAKIRVVKAHEAYARATARLLELSLAEANREQIERQLIHASEQSSVRAWEILAYFSAIPIAVSMLKFFKHITVDHFALAFQERERTDMTTELDERIPLDDSKLADYLSVFSFAPGTLLFLKKEFGDRATADGARFLTDLAGFYADGGMVFRKGASTFRRGGKPGPAVTFLREIDKVQNVFPSLHIEIAAHAHACTEDVIDAHAYDAGDYAAVKERMFRRAVTIIESTLLLKQHGWRDIAGGLVAISARALNFTKERADAIADGLFREVPDGMTENDVRAVRSEIKGLYAHLMERIAARPDVDFTQVLIDYVKDIAEEMEHPSKKGSHSV